MPPDDDSDLRSAFAELHRRQQDIAPDFGPMRDRALQAATRGSTGTSTPQAAWHPVRLASWAAAAVLLALAIWAVSDRWRAANPERSHAAQAPSADQLITRIEDHVDFHTSLALPEYPSDILLTSPSPSL
jgi:hypothetical protein